LGEDTVVFRLDPTRSHDVPEAHFPADARVVLMVDRYSAYKAMAQVKLGNIVLVFCWAHVRRDFVTVGKGWPEHKEWALAWLRRIRALYRHDRRRRSAQASRGEFTTADAELARSSRRCRPRPMPSWPTRIADSLPQGADKPPGTLDWLDPLLDDPRIPLDNNASERRVRGPAVGRKNYYGSGSEWSGRLAAMLFSLSATLTMAKINIRTWLTWYLESCAENGGQVPADINPFLPWKMSEEKRRELALDPNDSS
jgi:transposase